jgi:hypothetical protein
MKGAFVGSGGLGSQRYAGALGQSLADAQASLTGQQYGALSAGYQNALKAALDEAQLQNLAAKTQADIAGQEQALGLKGAGALTQAGAERQKFEQAKLDYPLSTATNVSGLLRGFQVPISGTETKVGPGQQSQFGPSILSNIGTLSGLLGSAVLESGTLNKIARELLPSLFDSNRTIDPALLQAHFDAGNI